MKFTGIILGDILLVLAFLAYFMQDLLSKFLPDNMVSLLIENKLLLLILGMVFSFVGLLQIIKAKAAEFDDGSSN